MKPFSFMLLLFVFSSFLFAETSDSVESNFFLGTWTANRVLIQVVDWEDSSVSHNGFHGSEASEYRYVFRDGSAEREYLEGGGIDRFFWTYSRPHISADVSSDDPLLTVMHSDGMTATGVVSVIDDDQFLWFSISGLSDSRSNYLDMFMFQRVEDR